MNWDSDILRTVSIYVVRLIGIGAFKALPEPFSRAAISTRANTKTIRGMGMDGSFGAMGLITLGCGRTG